MYPPGCLLAVKVLACASLGLGVPAGLTSHRAVPSASRVAKKGVDTWGYADVRTALARSGARWYLDWSTSPVAGDRLARFVPMIRAAANVAPADLAQARRYGPYLLTFNEPDLQSQANMTVGQALSLWPELESTGLELSSPAVASGADRPGGWLDRFMRAAAARRYRVNFIALHWYGSDFRTTDAVDQLRGYLTAVHDRYPALPIWLTEYSLINFNGSSDYATGSELSAFVSASVRMLDRLGFVARFAWFALPVSSAHSTGLYGPGGVPTAAGRAFSEAR